MGFCNSLCYLNSCLSGHASFKQQPKDFIVTESLAFDFDNQAGYSYVQVEKQQLNTKEMIHRVAHILAIDSHEIGYAGLKDKQSISRQWLSIPGKIDDFRLLALDDLPQLSVLDIRQHSRKLRVGDVKHNHFLICLKDITANRAELDARLQVLQCEGFPNYFGQQRFGNKDSNIEQLKHQWMIQGDRDAKLPTLPAHHFLYSVARAYLFNCCLSLRMEQKLWQKFVKGDLLLESESDRYYPVKDLKQPLSWLRLTGPMLGKQGFLAGELALDFEQQACRDVAHWVTQLRQSPIDSSRRLYCIVPEQLSWQFLTANSLEISVTLPKGVYATALLRELIAFGNSN